MRRSLLMASVLVLFVIPALSAGNIYIDTMAGYKNLADSVSYRETRVEFPAGELFSVGVVNSVENGLLVTGSLSNWRLGAYGSLYLSKDQVLSSSVFGGISFSSSLVNSALGMDAGIRARTSAFPLFPLVLLLKGEFYSDSANLFGFAGLSFGLGGIIRDLVLDIGYSPSYFLSYSGGTSGFFSGVSARLSILI